MQIFRCRVSWIYPPLTSDFRHVRFHSFTSEVTDNIYNTHNSVLTIFLCMAMMYPMKGLPWTGVMCPLGIPLARGVSGLQGTLVLGPPLGMRMGLLIRMSSAAVLLTIGVNSTGREDVSKVCVQCEDVRKVCVQCDVAKVWAIICTCQ